MGTAPRPDPYYWAADVLRECGAQLHLAHPLGIKAFSYQRVKKDETDARLLADLLRMGRLPESWIAPPQVRELREAVRYRHKLVEARANAKAQVHGVLGKAGVKVAVSDLFGVAGNMLLDSVALDDVYLIRVESLRDLVALHDREIAMLERLIARRLEGHSGYEAIQAIPGVGKILAAVFVAEIGDVSRFERPEQLASWAGMTPHHHESDTTVRRGRITKQGSRLVRWAAVEAAMRPRSYSWLKSRLPPHRRPPGQEDRRGGRRAQDPHAGLLRPARRRSALSGQPGGRVSTARTQPWREHDLGHGPPCGPSLLIAPTTVAPNSFMRPRRREGMTDTRALGVSTQHGCVPEAGPCTDPHSSGGMNHGPKTRQAKRAS